MDLGFIQRSIRTTLAVTGLVFLALLAHGRFDWAWGVGLGSVWACLNWILITALVRLLLNRERALSGRAKLRLALLGLIKFPLLYGTGYLLLRQGFPPLALLTGFWIILGVVLAKAVGRLLAGMEAAPVSRGVERRGGETT